MRYTNKLPDKNVNLSSSSPLGNFAKSIVGSLVVLAVIYFGMVWGINLIVPNVSPEAEIWLADLFLPEYDSDERDQDEMALQGRLDDLVVTAPPLPYNPVVFIEDTEEVNAYALPGGVIVITRALLDEIDSDNELSFILGHELGHIAHRDHLKGVGQVVTLGMLNQLCNYAAGVDLLSDVLTMYDRSVSRSQETAADQYGLDRLHACTGHIDGSLAFFERQRAKGELPAWAAYFSTHPKDETRINDLIEYALKQGYAFGS